MNTDNQWASWFTLTRSDKLRIAACAFVCTLLFFWWPSPITVLLYLPVVVATIYVGRRLDRYISRRFNQHLQ